MQFPERLLPHDLLEQATVRGNEYAWRLDDIPRVIKAAREAELVSIGGQLQFRFPDGGTAECYWVEVDTYRTVPSTLPWAERVTRTAEAALADFRGLQTRFDFIAEGRTCFEEVFQKWEAKGGDPASAMCFVWYVTTAADESETAEQYRSNGTS
jgi:hypothetical protein